LVEIQAYQCSNIISYLLKLAWQLPSGTSFDHVMATAFTQTITLLYIYFCVWGLDLRLNNVNYSYWYFPSSIIITLLYWTSETPLSSSITTSEYLICDRAIQIQWITSKIVFQVTRLWFHFITYSRKDKYKGRYFVEKKSSRYQEW